MTISLLDIERRRTIVSSFFVTVLTGIAFHLSTEPIWEILKEKGFSLSIDWIIPYIFVITTIRFFVGNQLQLVTIEKEPDLLGGMWLLDFLFIVSESFIIIFAAKSCSLKASLTSNTSFFQLIMYLLIIDIIWVLLQVVLGVFNSKWRRKVIPWGWGVLNLATFAYLYLLRHVLYNKTSLIISALVFTSAAIIDLFLIDYYGLLRKIRKKSNIIDNFMKTAVEEANLSNKDGGIPIGSVLVRDGKILGRGHNRRIQDSDPVAHAEIVCLRNAGRIGKFTGSVLYSTLAPCYLCAGAIVQFGIKKVVVGESHTFRGALEFMEQHGIEVVDLDLSECKDMMTRFIQSFPGIWSEDIGS